MRHDGLDKKHLFLEIHAGDKAVLVTADVEDERPGRWVSDGTVYTAALPGGAVDRATQAPQERDYLLLLGGEEMQ